MTRRSRGLFGGRSKRRKKPKRVEPRFARTLGRIGIVTRQPAVWFGLTASLSARGGRARSAAMRGIVCYLLGAAAGNLPKPLFGRPQPRHRLVKRPQVARGSFPSGHNAAEVAYVFGAAQEAPALLVPLGIIAALGHWSLVRAGKHYVSDSIAGGFIGLAVSMAVGRAWPPSGRRHRSRS